MLDFAPEWEALVSRAGKLLGEELTWAACDLRQGLGDPGNAALLALAPVAQVFLFSYVLQEVGQEAWEPCVAELFCRARPGSLFFFKDPNERSVQGVLAVLRQLGGPKGGGVGSRPWQEGQEFMWVCGNGLLVKKRVGTT